MRIAPSAAAVALATLALALQPSAAQRSCDKYIWSGTAGAKSAGAPGDSKPVSDAAKAQQMQDALEQQAAAQNELQQQLAAQRQHAAAMQQQMESYRAQLASQQAAMGNQSSTGAQTKDAGDSNGCAACRMREANPGLPNAQGRTCAEAVNSLRAMHSLQAEAEDRMALCHPAGARKLQAIADMQRASDAARGAQADPGAVTPAVASSMVANNCQCAQRAQQAALDAQFDQAMQLAQQEGMQPAQNGPMPNAPVAPMQYPPMMQQPVPIIQQQYVPMVMPVAPVAPVVAVPSVPDGMTLVSVTTAANGAPLAVALSTTPTVAISQTLGVVPTTVVTMVSLSTAANGAPVAVALSAPAAASVTPTTVTVQSLPPGLTMVSVSTAPNGQAVAVAPSAPYTTQTDSLLARPSGDAAQSAMYLATPSAQQPCACMSQTSALPSVQCMQSAPSPYAMNGATQGCGTPYGSQAMAAMPYDAYGGSMSTMGGATGCANGTCAMGAPSQLPPNVVMEMRRIVQTMAPSISSLVLPYVNAIIDGQTPPVPPNLVGEVSSTMTTIVNMLPFGMATQAQQYMASIMNSLNSNLRPSGFTSPMMASAYNPTAASMQSMGGMSPYMGGMMSGMGGMPGMGGMMPGMDPMAMEMGMGGMYGMGGMGGMMPGMMPGMESMYGMGGMGGMYGMGGMGPYAGGLLPPLASGFMGGLAGGRGVGGGMVRAGLLGGLAAKTLRNREGMYPYGMSPMGMSPYGMPPMGMPPFGMPSFGMPSLSMPSFGLGGFNPIQWGLSGLRRWGMNPRGMYSTFIGPRGLVARDLAGLGAMAGIGNLGRKRRHKHHKDDGREDDEYERDEAQATQTSQATATCTSVTSIAVPTVTVTSASTVTTTAVHTAAPTPAPQPPVVTYELTFPENVGASGGRTEQGALKVAPSGPMPAPPRPAAPFVSMEPPLRPNESRRKPSAERPRALPPPVPMGAAYQPLEAPYHPVVYSSSAVGHDRVGVVHRPNYSGAAPLVGSMDTVRVPAAQRQPKTYLSSSLDESGI